MRTAVLLVLLFLISGGAFSQSKARKAVARRGDGVQVLLQRYGLNTRQQQQQFRRLNQGRLTKAGGLVVGRSYVLPAAAPKAATTAAKSKAGSRQARNPTSRGISTQPLLPAKLFGPRYSPVPVRDRALRGAVYYLSPGHGGPDPGAIGQYGTHNLAEDEYAYDVTIRLARVLMEHGATVYMMVQDPNDGIRDEAVLETDHDEIGYPNQVIPLSQVYRLRKRIAEVNRLHTRHKGAYQRLIALHVDSRSAGQNIDVFFYHHPGNALGLRLAKNIHKVFTARYKRAQPNRPYSGNVSERGTLYEVRNSRAPAVFMELGNIRNSKDQRRFLVPDNRQALANWIYEGLLADYTKR
ncbi:N-acetylmuramoyl-L-alanine amidase family protein [Hymenobacter psychrotolerans]|uniref:N-acetylmuramoyl-L-alanine amidase n=1 Tax=Hymenobacter psychrotolerans DSM 18569 TaxID=1121959 RepID=A0A1M6Y4N5_9BACT|nr:N-acetylmuramoyl-L-alanine amidase [Hymenobacter psychrotolerans]SHL13182.1 N-acetylmuramoyl-L-alanine amidase [Hymenobacter psychrotolerans DSM 18569]